MIKAILEFDLTDEEDRIAHKRAVNVESYIQVLNDFATDLRSIWKYEELTEKEYEIVDRIRTKFYEAVTENNVGEDVL